MFPAVWPCRAEGEAMRLNYLSALLLLTCLPAGAMAQDEPAPLYVEAQRAEARGEYARAESLYDQAASQKPDDTGALLGRARMRSWLKRYPEAIDDYDQVIGREPDNALALTGRAWTRAWAGDFDAAKRDFEDLQRKEPYLLDAQKGLAYIALWRGDADDARRQFEQLAQQDRGNPDYVLAIAQAAYLEGDLESARNSYRQALTLKPGFEAAQEGLDAVEAAAVERRPSLTALLGRSESGEDSESGLRMMQAGMQVRPNVRLWINHDRGVGFDGFSADRRAQDAATTTLGGFFTYAPRMGTKVEVGQRDLADENQTVFSAEQVFFLDGGTTPKVGIWLADGDEATEWVANVGMHRWLGDRLAIEPTAYIGDDGVDREYRGSLLLSYTLPTRAQFGLGFAVGTKDTETEDRSIDRLFANVSVPIGRRATFLFYGWRESTEGFDSQTVLAAGATIHP
jgi:tetratricopeptide (TPR) repeat protein